MREKYIIAAKRTAIADLLGGLSNVPLVNFTADVIKKSLSESKIDPKHIEQVILGNVLTAGFKMGTARQASILAGIDNTISAYSLNMICGSGLKSVMNACNEVEANQSECIIAGGMESMTQSAHILKGGRIGKKLGSMELIDSLVVDGLTDAFSNKHMGITAENIANKYNLSRTQLDEFSIFSHQKAAQAQANGKFNDEIVPITVPSKRGDIIFDKDEHIRPNTNLESLAKIRPAFTSDGVVTAGNSSGINDGAAVIAISSKEFIEKHNIKPLAKVVSYAQAGLDPNYMGLGPVSAIAKLFSNLKENKSYSKLQLSDIDLLELNEAFAAQALGVFAGLSQQHNINNDLLLERTNIYGGAIALGHPIGASGARILTTLTHSLRQEQNRFGIASLCIGGGMGVAMLIENMS